ncbi:hypothetical protein H0H93_003905 [Arthromyces matolae]|nr:hypothetical protein H0H93_003905 [Arthromyces matolae]
MDVDDSSSPSPSYQRPPPDLKRKAMDVASANPSLFEPRLDFKRRTVPVAPPSPMRLSFTEPRINLKQKPIVVDPPPISQSNNWDEDVSMEGGHPNLPSNKLTYELTLFFEDLAVSALAEALAALTIAGPISRSRRPSRPNYLPLTVASPPFINPQPFIAQSLSLRPPTASSVASSSSYFASPAPSGPFGSAAPSSSYSAPPPLAPPNFFVPLVPPHTGRNAPRSSLPFSLVPSVPPKKRVASVMDWKWLLYTVLGALADLFDLILTALVPLTTPQRSLSVSTIR